MTTEYPLLLHVQLTKQVTRLRSRQIRSKEGGRRENTEIKTDVRPFTFLHCLFAKWLWICILDQVVTATIDSIDYSVQVKGLLTEVIDRRNVGLNKRLHLIGFSLITCAEEVMFSSALISYLAGLRKNCSIDFNNSMEI